MSQGAYLAGPLVALATIATMAIMLYRSFIREHRSATRRTAADQTAVDQTAVDRAAVDQTTVDPTAVDRTATARPVGTFRPMDDYGLLVTATTCRTLDDAQLITEHLRGAGIRATLVTAPDGRLRVLVFADEVMRARRLVG